MISSEDRSLRVADGAEIHYHIRGPVSGRPPVFLFIHGLGSNWTRWKRLAEEPFFRRSRLVIPDLRGHGESLTRKGIYADQVAQDLSAILRKENIARPVIVGHCLGANIGVKIYERDPGNIRGLILIEPFVIEDLRGAWRILQMLVGPVVWGIEGGVRTLNALGLRRRRFRKIDFSVYDDWVRPRLTNLLNIIRWMGPWADFQCMPVASYLASYRMLLRYHPVWDGIETPVLALVAHRGGVQSEGVGRRFPNRPGFRTVEIEGGHFVLTDNRTAVSGQIEAFVSEMERNRGWSD